MLKLREIRLEKGLSVPELSRRSGVSRRTIEDIEARGDCRISTARLLCDAMEISLDDIFPGKQNSQHKSRLVSRPGGFCAK